MLYIIIGLLFIIILLQEKERKNIIKEKKDIIIERDSFKGKLEIESFKADLYGEELKKVKESLNNSNLKVITEEQPVTKTVYKIVKK